MVLAEKNIYHVFVKHVRLPDCPCVHKESNPIKLVDGCKEKCSIELNFNTEFLSLLIVDCFTAQVSPLV